MTEFQQNYYAWLYDGITKNTKKSYSQLLGKLFDKEFYSIVPNDDNRGEDGKNLRYFYITEVVPLGGAGLGDMNDLEVLGPCRCLEMMIGLAKRFEDELYGSRYNKTWVDIFWEMISNMGLISYDDAQYTTITQFDVDLILNKWLDRRYGRDGIGGLFPLKKALKNQSKVEIWYQMMSYLDEKYPI